MTILEWVAPMFPGMKDAGIDAYMMNHGKDADTEELVVEIYRAMAIAQRDFLQSHTN